MTAHNVEGHVEIPEEDAKAGQTGVHVRYILILSTLLVIGGFGIAMLMTMADRIP